MMQIPAPIVAKLAADLSFRAAKSAADNFQLFEPKTFGRTMAVVIDALCDIARIADPAERAAVMAASCEALDRGMLASTPAQRIFGANDGVLSTIMTRFDELCATCGPEGPTEAQIDALAEQINAEFAAKRAAAQD